MRIILYPKYISTEESQACFISNCSVVIDGQNYFHHLYEESGIPFVFGGEADKYAVYMKKQLQMFKQANVKCYIVFKGGDTDIENKIKKFKSLFFSFTNQKYVAPIFLKDAHIQMVHEMDIDYAFCVMESKDECVALAQRLGCPVISNDIDFCFRKAPYIPRLTMTFDKKTNSIQCRMYKLQDFLQKNSLSEEKLAIFGTLTDTIVFPISFFDSLFKTWRVVNKNLIAQIKNQIRWLSEHSEQEAREEISKILTNEYDRNKFWFNYDKILTNMRKDEPGHVTEYLLNFNVTIVRQDPEWFEKGVVCKHVPPVYINLYKSGVIEGSGAFENISENSLFLSISIVKYAYNLLTNYRKDTFKLYQDANHYIEINTEDPSVRKPCFDCGVSVFENGWDQVKHLKLFEHFLTENKINIELVAKLPADAAVWFIALVYFARKKKLEEEDVTKEVYAAVLSYVILHLKFNIETCSMNFKEKLHVKCVIAKYFRYDQMEAMRIFDGKAINRFVELQYCIQHMNYLNILCGSPYPSTLYRNTYNATFIYKIFYDMRVKDGDDFVNELFQIAPTLLDFIKELLQVYRELLICE